MKLDDIINDSLVSDWQPIYTVYALTDGTITDIDDTDDFETALIAFDHAVKAERDYREYYSGVPETTVCLYEPHHGIMHAETTIEQT